MRALVVVALAAFAPPAAAEPETRCFAGTQVDTVDKANTRESVVVTWVTDRANRTVQKTTWSERDPDRAGVRTLVIDAEHGTFTADNKYVAAKGTMEGAPWQWTTYRETATGAGFKDDSETHVTADKLVTASTGYHQGKLLLTSRLEATAFDCKQLASKRAALDHTAKTAVHTCFAGTSVTTSSVVEGARRIVIEQVVDAKAHTVELRRWTEGSGKLLRTTFAIDGTAIAVTMSSITGKGTLVGNDYAWTGQMQALELTARGTLGGAKHTEVFTARTGGKEVSHSEVATTAFDCKKLAEQRAVLATAAAAAPHP